MMYFQSIQWYMSFTVYKSTFRFTWPGPGGKDSEVGHWLVTDRPVCDWRQVMSHMTTLRLTEEKFTRRKKNSDSRRRSGDCCNTRGKRVHTREKNMNKPNTSDVNCWPDLYLRQRYKPLHSCAAVSTCVSRSGWNRKWSCCHFLCSDCKQLWINPCVWL